MAEVELELSESTVWEKPEYAQSLGKERAGLEKIVNTINRLNTGIEELKELLSLAQEETDEDLLDAANKDLLALEQHVNSLEFQKMFSGAMDPANAYLDIQAGSGGTEAQDWAEMLLRMYLRWGEEKGFETDLVEVSGGAPVQHSIAALALWVFLTFLPDWNRRGYGLHPQRMGPPSALANVNGPAPLAWLAAGVVRCVSCLFPLSFLCFAHSLTARKRKLNRNLPAN